MPIDPSIALQVKPVALADPMEMFGKMQQLKHLDQQNQLLGIQQQQLGDTLANNRGVRAVFGPDENYETGPDGVRVLKQAKQNELWRYSPEVGNQYADNMQKMRDRAATVQKDRAAAAAHEFDLKKKKYDATVEATIGLLHSFNGILQKYGGDPTRPYDNPMALQTAEAEVERTLRPQVRQQLIAAGVVDPNSPETPFTLSGYSAVAASKEKFTDLLTKELLAKTGASEIKPGENHHWMLIFKDGRAPIDTGVGTEETFGQPVAIQATKDQPAGAISVGTHNTVKEIPYNLGKGAKGLNEFQSKSLAHYEVMKQANDEIGNLGADSKDTYGRVVKGVKKVPFIAGLRSSEADPGFFVGIKDAGVNGLLSDREQQFVQASEQFITTLGYHFSGMQIPQHEFGKLWRTYTGMPNDSEAVLRQKARARQKIIDTAEKQGGVAEDASDDQRKTALANLISQGALDSAEIEKVRRQELAGGKGRESLVYDPTKKAMLPQTGGAGGSWGAPAAAPAASEGMPDFSNVQSGLPAAPAAAPVAEGMPDFSNVQSGGPAAAPAAAPDFSNVQSGSPAAPAGPYGKREDGTAKGEGYFGTIPRTDGGNQISGELSVGVNINGKETLIPTMVPTLTKPELDFLLSADKNAIFDRKNPMAVGIMDKAVAYAKQRMSQGKSVWAEPGEKYPLPVEFPNEMRQHLREGYERDFTVDGQTQTWTLKNGQPVQVR